MAHELIKGTFCSSGDRRELLAEPDLSEPRRANYEQGIPPICSESKINGGQPPSRADFNEIYRLILGNLYELQNGGMYGYNAAVAAQISGYPKNAVLCDVTNSRFVRSLVDNNTTSDLTDTTKWEPLTLNTVDKDLKLNRNMDNISATGYDVSNNLNSAGITTVKAYSYNQSTGVWYRIWSDNWCEQGGTISPGTNYPPSNPDLVSITMPVTMADTNFYVNKSFSDNHNIYATNYQVNVMGMYISNANTLTTYQYSTMSRTVWRAEGYCTGVPS